MAVPLKNIKKMDLSEYRNPQSCAFMTKIFLKEFGYVELHALGNAT
jgi:hypothetical protein